MKYRLVLLPILIMVFCTQLGLSTYTYVGPYYVEFNDSAHRGVMISYEPTALFKATTDNSGETIYTLMQYFYFGSKTSNKSELGINIDEGDIDESYLSNLSSLKPETGFVELQKLSRVIDGVDATYYKYRNVSRGWIDQLAVFAFKVQFKNYDYISNNKAVVSIHGTNYTDSEFDRVLDTFKIYRLKED